MFVYLFWLVCHVARLPDFPPVLLAVRRRARPPASATAITLVVSFFRKLLLFYTRSRGAGSSRTLWEKTDLDKRTLGPGDSYARKRISPM